MNSNTSGQRVRVRFAPSPTGPLHIGGVRTALYNYLFARQHGGDMLLRIEDTDSGRFVPGAEDYILESLKWLGIEVDEGVGVGGENGPYRQSERRDLYRKYVEQLLSEGKAYKAYDTPEELAAAREKFENFQYDATTRTQMKNSLTMSAEECTRIEASGTPFVVRLLIQPNEDISVMDLIRGKVVINSSVLDDKVLYKSADDLPTYHLANIVDDHHMGITHVIRGEEWISSAPLHVLLYRALGWEDTMPRFAHLPLLLKPEGNGKLSKRDGDRLGFPVFPLEWKNAEGGISSGYRESGYLPEAVINFLALLGWNPGDDQEMMSMAEMIKAFDLNRVSKSGAKFDYEKGKWFNHKYIQGADLNRLAELCMPYLIAANIPASLDRLAAALAIVRDRITLLPDVVEQIGYLFVAPKEYDEKTVKKRWKEGTAAQLSDFLNLMEAFEEPLDTTDMEEKTQAWMTERGYGMGAVMNALRLSLVGKPMGPHIYDIIHFIGRGETNQRIRKAIETLG